MGHPTRSYYQPLVCSDGRVRFSLVQHPFLSNLELDQRFGSFFLVNLNPKLVQVQFKVSSGPNQVYTLKIAEVIIQAIFMIYLLFQGGKTCIVSVSVTMD